MSAPVERSSSRDEFLEYAPKRIRDRTMSGQRESRSSSDDETDANGTFSFYQDAERSGTSHAIEPTLVPEPPSKSWREAIAASSSGSDYDGGQDDSTKHVMLRSFLVLVVAALVAFGIVVFGPAARQLVVKSQSAITQMALQRQPKALPQRADAGPSTRSSRLDRPPARVDSQGNVARPNAHADAAASQVATPPGWIADNAPPDGSSVWAKAMPPAPSPADRAATPADQGAPDASKPSTPVAAHMASASPPDNAAAGKERAPSAAALSRPPQGRHAAAPSPQARHAAAPPAPSRLADIKATPDNSSSQKPAVRRIGRSEIELLMKQGDDFVSVGDFSSARIVFGRIAEAGEARGALALAATYDPDALKKLGAVGVMPDLAKAQEWYRRAEELGSAEAKSRLETLADRPH